jgi:hypothetical protein
VAKTSLGQRENECDDFLNRRKWTISSQASLYKTSKNSKIRKNIPFQFDDKKSRRNQIE